ncbi:tRNA (adenosine(37)-N6)-threonylcarbamoyltransferase complex ATPase subunit type 1 TsaE [uncultured Aureimonas sp.]|uniref:tRNA (adenosine(37)-N6)-threonylcarbamoyltransferase complex ATPase subunit type 1 TsaE n=1 Tax=uncultured Aureimonas sp. TaxID=1604662 RepID=UPI0025E86D56|nr:tRNA (adenosine(37)-N6)-threonylcarbamoyltransferase complex ATPase subunit type 1 TsaE [uncultured Aureimonas sp.]
MTTGSGAAADETRSFTLDLPDEAATLRLARLLAPLLNTGDVVALSGPLGAGKTTLARALIRAVTGDPDLEVPSPTYTLVQLYPTRPRISHFDLYRIGDPDELVELGFDEAAETGIVLAEWPEQAPDVLRAANLRLTLADRPGGGRQVTIHALPEAAARIERPLALHAFVAAAGEGDADRKPFPGDASARRYEVLTTAAGRPLILMDSPDLVLGPPVRDGRAYAEIARSARNTVPFVAVAEALRARGLATPRIEAFDTARGFVLMEDLGREGVLDADGRPIPERYETAMRALAHLHATPFDPHLALPDDRPYEVPPFDHAAMAIEASLLVDWYVPHVFGRPVTEAERAAFEAVWSRLFHVLDDAERHLVQRDVQAPNLVWRAGRKGIDRIAFLDFQDAMVGPSAYDVAALAHDPRVTIEPALEARLRAAYVDARRTVDPAFDETGFATAYAIMAAQRQTKILGIFVRLLARDGKPQYLRHIPRIKAYLRTILTHPALGELASLYEAWHLLDEADAPSR